MRVFEQLDYMVTGIGVNVNQAPEDFSPEDRAEYLKKYRADCTTTGHQVQLITLTSHRSLLFA